MLPLLLVGAAVGLVVWVGAVGAAAEEERKKITKKYTVLGMRGTGKTQLTTFLSTGELPKESIQTLTINKTSRRETNVNNECIVIDQSFDVAGDTSAYEDWRRIVQTANIVIYLIRLDNYFEPNKDPEYFRRIKRDIALIAENLNKDIKQDYVFIIGTHRDKIDIKNEAALMDSFRGKMPNEIQEHIDEIKGKVELMHLFSQLNTKEGAKHTLELIYKHLDIKLGNNII